MEIVIDSIQARLIDVSTLLKQEKLIDAWLINFEIISPFNIKGIMELPFPYVFSSYEELIPIIEQTLKDAINDSKAK